MPEGNIDDHCDRGQKAREIIIDLGPGSLATCLISAVVNLKLAIKMYSDFLTCSETHVGLKLQPDIIVCSGR